MSATQNADVEFSWPPPLPYAGVSRLARAAPDLGHVDPAPAHGGRTDDGSARCGGDRSRGRDPLARQRGVSHRGDRCDSPVLGLYQVHGGRLARAQMFYFDPAAVSRFLATAQSDAA